MSYLPKKLPKKYIKALKETIEYFDSEQYKENMNNADFYRNIGKKLIEYAKVYLKDGKILQDTTPNSSYGYMILPSQCSTALIHDLHYKDKHQIILLVFKAFLSRTVLFYTTNQGTKTCTSVKTLKELFRVKTINQYKSSVTNNDIEYHTINFTK